MSSPLVLLVSRSASRTQLYRESLDRLGISCLGISGLKEVCVLAAGTPFSGILLDMPIMAKSSAGEKADIEDILKALPSAYLNIAPASDAVKLLTATGTQGTARSLEEFAEICKGFTPRLVSPKDRYPLFLNALLHCDDAGPSPQKTATLNVSSNGCFLFFTDNRITYGQQVMIDFVGFEDRTPISAEVCWIRPWGDQGNHLPGIGVRFITISDLQSARIASLLEKIKNR